METIKAFGLEWKCEAKNKYVEEYFADYRDYCLRVYTKCYYSDKGEPRWVVNVQNKVNWVTDTPVFTVTAVETLIEAMRSAVAWVDEQECSFKWHELNPPSELATAEYKIEVLEEQLQQKDREIEALKSNRDFWKDSSNHYKKDWDKYYDEINNIFRTKHYANEMKLKTIEAWMELERQYRENRKENGCPLCAIHRKEGWVKSFSGGQTQGIRCYGCPLADKHGCSGCEEFQTRKKYASNRQQYKAYSEHIKDKKNKHLIPSVELLKNETIRSSQARADFFKNTLKDIIGAPAELFTPEGWKYFAFLNRDD